MMRYLAWGDGLRFPTAVITEKVAFLGQSGSGKTYAALKLAEGMLDLGAQVISVDPVGVHWGLRVSASGKRRGLSIAVFGGDHGDLPLLPTSGTLVGEVLASRGISAVLDVSEFTTAELKRFGADFAEAFFQAKKRHRSPVHLFLEEAQLLVPQAPEPDEGRMLNRFERLFKLGRNYGVGWSLISQQPQAVHKRVLNQAGTVVALRTLAKHEKKAILDWVSDKVTRAEELDLINDLPSLETGVAHVWSPSFLKLSKTVRVLKRTTFDSSSTPEFGGAAARKPTLLAPVDLAHLRAEMQAMVVEAERTDVTALQKQVEQLKADLALQAKLAERARAEFEQRLQRAKATGKVREVHVLTEKQVKRLEEVSRRLAGAADAARSLAVTVDKALAKSVPGAPAAPAAVLTPAIVLKQSTEFQTGGKTAHEALSLRSLADPVPSALNTAPGPTRNTSQPAIRKGARAMLAALATQRDYITRAQLATLVGMAVTGGTFSSYLSTLRAAGYIVEDHDGRLQLAYEGSKFFGTGGAVPRAPSTTAELVQLWSRHLRAGARRMLDVLVASREANGNKALMSRTDLAASVGMEPTGGTFSSYLSALRSGGLIEEERGGLRASDTLFPTAA